MPSKNGKRIIILKSFDWFDELTLEQLRIGETILLIDTDNAIIVDVQASRSVRTGETHATRMMIERVRERFDLWPERLIADTAYGSGEMLGWLVEERGIEPHIPVIDKSKRADGTFSREDFAYDHKTDAYICPAGKELRRNRRKFQSIRNEPKDTGFAKYGAIKAECDACHLKERCCPKGAPRRIMRSEHEGARQMARDIAATDEYALSCKLRKRSRCSSPISSASSASAGSACAAHAAQTTNSSSPQPPRTSESWPSSSRCQRRRDPHERRRFASSSSAPTSRRSNFKKRLFQRNTPRPAVRGTSQCCAAGLRSRR